MADNIQPGVLTKIDSRKFLRRLSALFIALVLILATVGVLVWTSSNRFSAEDAWVQHAKDVENATQTAIGRLSALQAAATVYGATGAPLRLAEFSLESPRLDDDLTTLAALVEDDPAQTRRVQAFSKAAQARYELLSQIVSTRRKTGQIPALPEQGPTQLRRDAAQIIAANNEFLSVSRQKAHYAARMTRILTASAIVLSIGFLGVMFWLMRHASWRNAMAARQLRAANSQLADALEETRRRSNDLKHLNQFAEMLQACRTIDEVRAGLVDAFGQLLPGLGGRMALLNPSQNLLAVGAHWGEHGMIAESIYAPEDCWALRRGQAYAPAEASGGFVCQHVHWPNPDQPDARYFCLPLAAQGEVIGVLTFDSLQSIDAHSRSLAVAAAEQLAMALANLRLQETLRTQSIRDPLTGLFNRRYLEVSVERELARATRRNQPLTVMMLDLDHFKQFNDTHGHDGGDALLVQFAKILKRNTRSEDIACRYGGEEFTILLPEVDAVSARARAEQIRAATSEMVAQHRGKTLAHVSVSIGMAAFPENARVGADLMRSADSALYRAKRSGRNRVVAASDDETA
ncbi:MAG TPA: diguanylate cyclase [Rudaea sp.]|nr:diguanylate cyclase [Rudaea sp.]